MFSACACSAGPLALGDTVPQPLVILDSDLRVEKANVAFYEAFQTRADVTRDRRLTELGNGQWNDPASFVAV